MAQSRFYSSTAQPTVLTANVGPAATLIQVAAVTGFPPTTPYILALDYNTPSEEIVLVTIAAGTSLTVTRGYDGTSATSHNVSAGVRHTWTAADGNDSRAHEGSSQQVHGLVVTSSVVGTVDVQTLTNKTLTAPIINGATLSAGTNLASPNITGTVTGAASYTGITATNPNITGTVTGNSTVLMPTFQADIDANPSEIVKKRSATQTGALTSWRDDVGTSLAFVTAAGIARWRQGMTAGAADALSIDSSGNLTQAANMTMGAWTTFVPTWTASVTPPTLGNGVLTSQWARIGRTIHWNGILDLGTTSNGGTGLWLLSTPVAAAGVGFTQYGVASYVDTGTNEYIGNIQIPTAGTTAAFVVKTSSNAQSSAQVSNTVPVGASQNTLIQWSITYQAAS